MKPTRRTFLLGATGLGFAGLASFITYRQFSNPYQNAVEGFGPLIQDTNGILDLPKGFQYKILAQRGNVMSDGFLHPGEPDGMAAFPGENGRVILVCNHELDHEDTDIGPFGKDAHLINNLAPDLMFDRGSPDKIANGGTTTLHYDPQTEDLLWSGLTLAGTVRNCAGGHTPRQSWLSCEETRDHASDGWQKDHGYVFEVPSKATSPVKPIPLTAMGRFRHEATGTDPRTGIVYMTEDDKDGLFYRFIPNNPDDLAKGGRLQALAIKEQSSAVTRNWRGDNFPVEPGNQFQVHWIDLRETNNPNDDMHLRGHEAGATVFARGEGLWFSENGDCYFTCTTGGPEEYGQVWRYRPSLLEGTDREAEAPGVLELFIEPRDKKLLKNCDNLTMAPNGDLVICEDRDGRDYLRGVTPDGLIYTIAGVSGIRGELAGCCFSPDGSTLFVNMMVKGLTVAIKGPWNKRIV